MYCQNHRGYPWVMSFADHNPVTEGVQKNAEEVEEDCEDDEDPLCPNGVEALISSWATAQATSRHARTPEHNISLADVSGL